MTILLKWAWPLLVLGLLFDAFAMQLTSHIPYLENATIGGRSAFALGSLAGDLPVILIVGIIALVVLRISCVPTINFKVFAVSLAFGSVFNALLLHPILIEMFI